MAPARLRVLLWLHVQARERLLVQLHLQMQMQVQMQVRLRLRVQLRLWRRAVVDLVERIPESGRHRPERAVVPDLGYS